MKKREISIILDSGAFSAWKKGVSIDIDQYVAFCLKYLDLIAFFVNLDVIPGKWGMKRMSEEMVEKSAALGWKNYEYMLSKGIPRERLIHVFHQGESFNWLDRMVEEKLPYIGISPANDRTTSEKVLWLDRCMEHVTNSKGFPLLKFHGFGVTAVDLLLRYPWYSVDSTAWVQSSRMGSLFTAKNINGQYDYLRTPLMVDVSFRNPEKKQEGGRHIDTLKGIEKEQVLLYIYHQGFKLGKSFLNEKGEEVIVEKGLCNDYRQRDEFNAKFFLDLEKALPKWPWAFKKKAGRLL